MQPQTYQIIASGSSGNAVVVCGAVLIDCGVPFSDLKPYYRGIKLVLLTHIHGDHFKKATIRRLARERPSLRWGCGQWLAAPLMACGVPKSSIDIMRPGKIYGYGLCNVIPFPLTHNVPNMGYKIHFSGYKMIYATDTNSLNGITALNYDLYLIEANYGEKEIEEKIRAKKERGEYAYEIQARRNHLSMQKCNDWLYRNMGPRSKYVYMHRHEEAEHDHNSETP